MRPGVDTAKILAHQFPRNVSLWEDMERHYHRMLEKKDASRNSTTKNHTNNTKSNSTHTKSLLVLDQQRDAIAARLQYEDEQGSSNRSSNCSSSNNNSRISLEEFLHILVEWKFQKGKPRYALWKYLRSIQEDDWNSCLVRSFEKAQQEDIPGAIQTLSQLPGVGPATASAVLSLYRPSLFAFMDDEVIEALYTDGKRGYTLSIYMHMNDKCQTIAQELNQLLLEKNKKDTTLSSSFPLWSCYRVGRALWTASQLAAIGNEESDRILLSMLQTECTPSTDSYSIHKSVTEKEEEDESITSERYTGRTRKRRKKV